MRAMAVANTTTVVAGGTEKLVTVCRPFAGFAPFSAYETIRDIRIRRTAMCSTSAVNVVKDERPTPLLAAAGTNRLTARNTDHSLVPKATA